MYARQRIIWWRSPWPEFEVSLPDNGSVRVWVCYVRVAVAWGSITVQQFTWGKTFHCRTTMSGCFRTAVCNVSGMFLLTNMYRNTCKFNFTILFFQLIADLLAHYLLPADDSCECIQACILDCVERGKFNFIPDKIGKLTVKALRLSNARQLYRENVYCKQYN